LLNYAFLNFQCFVIILKRQLDIALHIYQISKPSIALRLIGNQIAIIRNFKGIFANNNSRVGIAAVRVTCNFQKCIDPQSVMFSYCVCLVKGINGAVVPRMNQKNQEKQE